VVGPVLFRIANIRITSKFELTADSNAIDLHFGRKPSHSFTLMNFLALVSRENEQRVSPTDCTNVDTSTFHHDGVSRMLLTLGATAITHPLNEVFHLGAVLPGEAEKFACIQRRGFWTEKRLKAPSYIGAVPRVQSIAASNDPVIAQSLKHPLSLYLRQPPVRKISSTPA
jgi:hypothetical protein